MIEAINPFGDPVIFKIVLLGAKALRQKCIPFTNATDFESRKLFYNTFHTGLFTHALGLAAPQINENRRFFIMRDLGLSKNEPDSNELEDAPFVLCLNPKILSKSNEMEGDFEACLSIPDMIGFVPRHKEIEVEYESMRSGQRIVKVKQQLKDMAARVFQHEYDHLDGILYPDRIRYEDQSLFMTTKQFEAFQDSFEAITNNDEFKAMIKKKGTDYKQVEKFVKANEYLISQKANEISKNLNQWNEEEVMKFIEANQKTQDTSNK